MCKQSGTNTQTVVQNPTIPDWLLTQFQNLATRAQGVSDRPYNVGTQRNVADFTPDQLQAFSQVRQDQGIYQPYMNAATGYAQIGGSTINGNQIANYSNPYQQQVIDATMANIQSNNATQQANLRGNAALQGGLGNDRLKIAQAELAKNQNLATNQTLATLNAQNYNQALGAAQQDRSAAQQAASQFANLGSNAQALAAQDASNLMLTGGLQEQKAQQQLDTTTANIAAQEQYPFATSSWLGGVLQGASPAFTGYSQTTSTPAPSTMQSLLGLGSLGLGAYLRSDERAKENMRPVGETYDGQTIYAYDEGGPTKLGLSAQEVMTVKPEAVIEDPSGLLAVNYDVAVSEAEPRDGYNDGGLTLPGAYSVNKSRIRAMGQPTDGGNLGPYPDVNTGALSQQAGMMMSMANPVKRLKAPTPVKNDIYDEAKSLAKDMQSNFQLGGDMMSAGRKGLAAMNGYSVKDEAYGPPVPEGLANGGRVGYYVGGLAAPGSFRGAQQAGMPTPYGASNIVPQAPQPQMQPSQGLGMGAAPGSFRGAQEAPGVPTGPAEGSFRAAQQEGMPSDDGQTIAGAQGSNSLTGGLGAMLPGYGSNPGLGAALMAAAPGIASGRNFAEGLARGMAGGVQGYNQWEIAEQRKAQEALQNRIAEEKLRMMTEEFKQRQAEFAATQDQRKFERDRLAAREQYELGKLKMDAMTPEEKAAAELRVLENKVTALTGYERGTPEHRQAMQQAAGFGAKSQTDDIKEYEYDVNALRAENARRVQAGEAPVPIPAFGQWMDQRNANKRPQTTIDMRQGNAAGQALGKRAGEAAAEVLDAGVTAEKELADLGILSELQKQVNSGPLTTAAVKIADFARQVGISPQTLQELTGLPPDFVGNGQAFTSAINTALLSKIGPGGMPAQGFSNADRDFLAAAGPSLVNNPRGNEIIIEIGRIKAEAKRDMARAFNKWRKTNPEGDVYEFLDQYQTTLEGQPSRFDAMRQKVAKILGNAPIADKPLVGVMPPGQYTWDPNKGVRPQQ